jgi:hypothetical protein
MDLFSVSDPDSIGLRIRIRKAKMTNKKDKVKKFHVLKCGCFLVGGGPNFCQLKRILGHQKSGSIFTN